VLAFVIVACLSNVPELVQRPTSWSRTKPGGFTSKKPSPSAVMVEFTLKAHPRVEAWLNHRSPPLWSSASIKACEGVTQPKAKINATMWRVIRAMAYARAIAANATKQPHSFSFI
jgi:hypothetical protein